MKLEGVRCHTNQKNGFRVLRLHYTADPDKRSKEWYDKTREGYTQEAWDQEFEIKFSSYAGKGVYRREFRNIPALDGGHLLLDAPLAGTKPIFRIWDFGYHHPAVLFIQEALPNHHYVFDELMGTDIYLQDFVPIALAKTDDYARQYNGVIRDFCDPAGKHVKSTGKSDLQILHEFGVHPVFAPFEVKDTINYVRGALTAVVEQDKMPVLLIDNARCPITVAGLSGGYRYPTFKAGKAESEKPQEDGYYEHLMDNLRYYAGHRLQYYTRRKKDESRRQTSAIEQQIIAASQGPHGNKAAIESQRQLGTLTTTSDPSRRYPKGQRRVHSRGSPYGPHQNQGSVGGVQRRQIIIRQDMNGPVYTPRVG
jgi:hypothetical protein